MKQVLVFGGDEYRHKMKQRRQRFKYCEQNGLELVENTRGTSEEHQRDKVCLMFWSQTEMPLREEEVIVSEEGC